MCAVKVEMTRNILGFEGAKKSSDQQKIRELSKTDNIVQQTVKTQLAQASATQTVSAKLKQPINQRDNSDLQVLKALFILLLVLGVVGAGGTLLLDKCFF